MNQDKLAALMLEDLREILKAEVDDNLRNIQTLNPTPTTVYYGVLGSSERESVISGGMGIVYYDPNPTWKEWFLDCLGL